MAVGLAVLEESAKVAEGVIAPLNWEGDRNPSYLKDGVVHVQAGAGVVADSDPHKEHEECLRKARGVLAAVEAAEGLE